VACYVYDERAQKAEIAIVIEDRWQGRGLGTRLLDELMGYANGRGIRCLRAYVLADNLRMLNLETESHGSRPGVGEEAAAVSRVSGPESLGQQRLERLAVEFRLEVAEHLGEAGIRPHDPAGAVHHQDPHGRRLQNGIGQAGPAAEALARWPLSCPSRPPGHMSSRDGCLGSATRLGPIGRHDAVILWRCLRGRQG
jgi:hypothetical protein